MTNKKPKLDKSISSKDFKDFYWLKKELVSFCKEYNLISSGSKMEIAEGILHFLETGKKLKM